jgi:Spy/CpxP family protein refolding chaperone
MDTLNPGATMRTLTLNPLQTPLRMLAATLVVAVAAGMSQTALAQPHGGRDGGMGGPGMALGHPHQVDRMLDAVNATADQRTQIKQIMQAAKADMKAQHDAGRQLREQSQALFAQPTVDARAAEALRQQMLAQHDQASKRMLQAMLDVSRVLTPEQRKTLADRMAQRRSMMERHHAERESIDRPTR